MNSVRTALLSRIDNLSRRADRISAHLRAPIEADSEEAASALSGEEVVEALDGAARQELGELRATIDRMDAGTWGVCVACGGQIAAARLAAMPTATRCVACSA